MLTFSIGNSSLRLARFEDSRILESHSWPLESRPWTSLPLAGIDPGVPALIASVRPDLTPSLLEVLESRGLECQLLGRDFQLIVASRYRDPSEVGIDRLLAVLAASEMFPSRPVAVVDFGTALTVSVASAEGEFLGGLIAPGASTQGRLVPVLTPRLPAVEPARGPDGFLARSTREALSAGVHWMVVGGVERMLRGLFEQLGEVPRVVATGGEAALLAPEIPAIERVEPDLVLRGLRLAHARHLEGGAAGASSSPPVRGG